MSFAIACFSFSGALSSAAFRRRLPVFADRLRALLTDWQNTGVADAAELGTGLGVDTNPANNRVGRLVQIASPAAAAKLKGEPYLARWHVDNHWSDGTRNPHALLLVVRKNGTRPLRHANLCLAATRLVDRCDSPEARMRALADPGAWHDVFERAACCPALGVGDAVFYREDVAHRTQDDGADRLALVVVVRAADRPAVPRGPTAEDVLCPAWAAAHDCNAEFMRCVCHQSCAQ